MSVCPVVKWIFVEMILKKGIFIFIFIFSFVLNESIHSQKV